MISFKNLKDLLVFEKYFGMKLGQKPFGNLYKFYHYILVALGENLRVMKLQMFQLLNVYLSFVRWWQRSHLLVQDVHCQREHISTVSDQRLKWARERCCFFQFWWLFRAKIKIWFTYELYLGCLLMNMSFFSLQISSWQISFWPRERNSHQYHLLHRVTYWLEPWWLRLRQ